MIRSLRFRNFTVFKDAKFDCGRNLNVIVGENGLGKTHILKAAYVLQSSCYRSPQELGGDTPTKDYLRKAVAKKLHGVFRPDELGRLARRQAGRNRAEIAGSFSNHRLDLAVAFNTASKTEVEILTAASQWAGAMPIYLPTRELMTIHPGFVSLYDTTHLAFEEHWRDLSVLLGAPLAKGAREEQARALLDPLESAMDGRIEMDGDRFYLKSPSGRLEMHLVAEGMRKLAMLARLIANGSLGQGNTLFWDEPEANLNPKLIRTVAKTIIGLAREGVQSFVATHSLFLMRELYLLQPAAAFEARWFGLHGSKAGVRVDQGPTIDDVGDVTALDEELLQSERYLEAP